MAGAFTRACAFNDCIQFALPCGFRQSVHLENHSSCIKLATFSSTACNTGFRRPDNCSAEYYRTGWTLHRTVQLNWHMLAPGALLELALLLFWYGYLHPGIVARANISVNDTQKSLNSLQQARVLQHWCYYVAGLLISLVISWELSAFGQTRLDILLLAPASYLSVIAPFVMRDKALPGRHMAGQFVALSGALLLLLPALWFSFSDNNLLPTLVLIGESLALLLLGIATRIRIFILSSASLLIVGALRALFLSTPPSLALMLLGVMLVVIATALFLVRHRLKIAWTQWE